MSKTDELFDSGSVTKKKVFVHGSHNLAGKIEWYTPSQYIESARKAMGAIDLDPCTSLVAQKTVQAGRFYTIEDDGLRHRWSGNVWLNPPYTARVIVAFIEKLLAHLDDGSVKQCITLTHNNADTLWFHKAAARCAVACFTRGRVRFYDEKGAANSPTHGHCFMYFGPTVARFIAEFEQYGWIVRGVCDEWRKKNKSRRTDT